MEDYTGDELQFFRSPPIVGHESRLLHYDFYPGVRVPSPDDDAADKTFNVIIVPVLTQSK